MTITAANVSPILTASSGNIITQITVGIAGAAITAGKLVYLSSQMQFQLAYAKDPVKSVAYGIALTNAAIAGQTIYVAVGGDINLGNPVAITVTSVFVVSGNNPGGIAPIADATTGWYPGTVGIAIFEDILRISIATHNGIAIS